jgi:hypothetical protein
MWSLCNPRALSRQGLFLRNFPVNWTAQSPADRNRHVVVSTGTSPSTGTDSTVMPRSAAYRTRPERQDAQEDVAELAPRSHNLQTWPPRQVTEQIHLSPLPAGGITLARTARRATQALYAAYSAQSPGDHDDVGRRDGMPSRTELPAASAAGSSWPARRASHASPPRVRRTLAGLTSASK